LHNLLKIGNCRVGFKTAAKLGKNHRVGKKPIFAVPKKTNVNLQ